MGMDDIRLSVSSCLAYSDVNKTGSSGLLSNCLASSAWCRGNPGVKGELEKRGDSHLSYIECRVRNDIFTIICHPFPKETLGQLCILSVTIFHTSAAPHVCILYAPSDGLYMIDPGLPPFKNKMNFIFWIIETIFRLQCISTR